ncbi:MAG TPA: LysM peptidoglycan-binding domain-containing protein [Anaerolineae bacterium]|nr:LysM peptidoglycan-binding domain-containing protein [Anaerolineae bacterium]HQK12988.1 LysM peptidoglycan-binding domain-containing protein [Anaerolineae bacterium]
MNAGAIVVLFLIFVAIVWAFWLIFKRDLMANNLGKLLTYFAGVILTLLIVLWITSRFLPWWAVRLINDTRQSATAKQLQDVSVDLFNQIVTNPGVVVTAVPVGPTPTPAASPIATPVTVPAQSLLPTGSERIHTVQSGETLYRISRYYGVDLQRLKQRNNLTSDTIYPGQQLIIP